LHAPSGAFHLSRPLSVWGDLYGFRGRVAARAERMRKNGADVAMIQDWIILRDILEALSQDGGFVAFYLPYEKAVADFAEKRNMEAQKYQHGTCEILYYSHPAEGQCHICIDRDCDGLKIYGYWCIYDYESCKRSCKETKSHLVAHPSEVNKALEAIVAESLTFKKGTWDSVINLSKFTPEVISVHEACYPRIRL